MKIERSYCSLQVKASSYQVVIPVVLFYLQDGSTMVIEAAKGGHTQVVKLLLEWPDRFLVNTASDQLAQLSVADAPLEEVSKQRCYFTNEDVAENQY